MVLEASVSLLKSVNELNEDLHIFSSASNALLQGNGSDFRLIGHVVISIIHEDHVSERNKRYVHFCSLYYTRNQCVFVKIDLLYYSTVAEELDPIIKQKETLASSFSSNKLLKKKSSLSKAFDNHSFYPEITNKSKKAKEQPSTFERLFRENRP